MLHDRPGASRRTPQKGDGYGMIGDQTRTRRPGARRPLVPAIATVAVALAAGMALECGNSSDDKASDQTAKAPAKTQAATPAGSTQTTPGQPPVSDVAKQFIAQGTTRLMAKRLGYPGTLVVVGPKGTVDSNNERWYKIGTKVTLRAASTKTARFQRWAAGCPNSTAPQCTVKISKGDYTRVFAVFKLDKQAAKSLKKSDPALKVGVFPDGSGPPTS